MFKKSLLATLLGAFLTLPAAHAAVDLLVPADASAGPQELGGNQFDAAPGLRLALSAPAS